MVTARRASVAPTLGSRWRNRRTKRVAVIVTSGAAYLDYRYEAEGQATRVQSTTVERFHASFVEVASGAR